MTSLAIKWAPQFYATLSDDRASSDELKDASLHGALGRWTAALTHVVARSFERLGYVAASKGNLCSIVPVPRNEYLGQDVMAFASGDFGWRFPAAVCELENSTDADRVAYSLWKVLCVRAGLRVVFCYRREPEAAPAFVNDLKSAVVDAMPLADRVALDGETLIIVGSRNEAATFPYGFFHAWKLNANTGRFERFARQ